MRRGRIWRCVHLEGYGGVIKHVIEAGSSHRYIQCGMCCTGNTLVDIWVATRAAVEVARFGWTSFWITGLAPLTQIRRKLKINSGGVNLLFTLYLNHDIVHPIVLHWSRDKKWKPLARCPHHTTTIMFIQWPNTNACARSSPNTASSFVREINTSGQHPYLLAIAWIYRWTTFLAIKRQCRTSIVPRAHAQPFFNARCDGQK